MFKQSKNSNMFFWWKKSLGNERREFQDSNELSLWELKILRCFVSFYVSSGDQTFLKLVFSKLLERPWKMFYWSEVLFSKQRHTTQVIANWRIKNHSAKTIPNQLIFMPKMSFLRKWTFKCDSCVRLYNILQGKYRWFLSNLKCDEFNLSKFVHGLLVHHFDTNFYFIFPII